MEIMYTVSALTTRGSSGSHDNMIKLWTVSIGESIRTLKGHGYKVRSVDMQGLLASSSDDYTIKVWGRL